VDGPRIRELREDLGLTQGQLASQAGISRENLRRIEAGIVKWSTLKTTEGLAVQLGVGRKEILVGRKPSTVAA